MYSRLSDISVVIIGCDVVIIEDDVVKKGIHVVIVEFWNVF